MRTAAIVIACTLALVACATPQQRADKLIATHGPTCDRLGFARDTDSWRNCVMQADATAASKQGASAAAYNAIMSNRPRTCTGFGNTLSCY